MKKKCYNRKCSSSLKNVSSLQDVCVTCPHYRKVSCFLRCVRRVVITGKYVVFQDNTLAQEHVMWLLQNSMSALQENRLLLEKNTSQLLLQQVIQSRNSMKRWQPASEQGSLLLITTLWLLPLFKNLGFFFVCFFFGLQFVWLVICPECVLYFSQVFWLMEHFSKMYNVGTFGEPLKNVPLTLPWREHSLKLEEQNYKVWYQCSCDKELRD